MRLVILAACALVACVDSSSISLEEEREMGLAVAEQATRLEQMAKARNTNTVVGLVYVLLGRAPGAAEQVALQVAGSAWMAKHSREAEREADRVAVVYLARAGLDPRGMPEFFQRLLDQERANPNELLAWFSTHPLTEEHIADTEAMIAQLPPEAIARGARDFPQFGQMHRRLHELPPPPPDRRALP